MNTLIARLQFPQALAMEFVLNAGDMLILNNRRFLHGRGASTPAYEADGQIISREALLLNGDYKTFKV
jgi:alpha-ketoglutarate-dependent taurine dioxygenase